MSIRLFLSIWKLKKKKKQQPTTIIWKWGLAEEEWWRQRRKQVGGQVPLAEVETRGYSTLAREANPASIAYENRSVLGPRWNSHFSRKIILKLVDCVGKIWKNSENKGGRWRSGCDRLLVTVCCFSAFFERAVWAGLEKWRSRRSLSAPRNTAGTSLQHSSNRFSCQIIISYCTFKKNKTLFFSTVTDDGRCVSFMTIQAICIYDLGF